MEPPRSSPHEHQSNAPGDAPAHTPESRWQERLLPLMVRMVVGLTLFFFVASFAQLAYLHLQIQEAPAVELPRLRADSDSPGSGARSAEFEVLATLDAGNLEQRYHQANVLLMSRVWARYLGFVTGMILALVGAVFILGKLREEASELKAKGAAGLVSLRSTSPGVVLAVFGVALMITTIVTHHEIITADSPIYLQLAYEKPAIRSDEAPTPRYNAAAGAEPAAGPPPDFP